MIYFYLAIAVLAIAGIAWSAWCYADLYRNGKIRWRDSEPRRRFQLREGPHVTVEWDHPIPKKPMEIRP